MDFKEIIATFRAYTQRKPLDGFTSIQFFTDGSGMLLDNNDKYISGTSFDNVEQLVELLTGEKELRETQGKYLEALRNHYPQGTKISMEVRSESVEVIIDKPY